MQYLMIQIRLQWLLMYKLICLCMLFVTLYFLGKGSKKKKKKSGIFQIWGGGGLEKTHFPEKKKKLCFQNAF